MSEEGIDNAPGVTRAAIVETLRRMLPDLKARYKVRSLALFGSYARGDQTAESDIDILVDFDPSIGLRFIDLANELEAALGKPVDLVSSRGVKPRYMAYIEQDLEYV